MDMITINGITNPDDPVDPVKTETETCAIEMAHINLSKKKKTP